MSKFVHSASGPERLSFLVNFPVQQQYKLILSIYGLTARHPSAQSNAQIHQRIKGLELFVKTVEKNCGSLPAPLQLTPDHFYDAVRSWKSLGLKSVEFKSMVNVASWLFDILIEHEPSPYPKCQEVNL